MILLDTIIITSLTIGDKPFCLGIWIFSSGFPIFLLSCVRKSRHFADTARGNCYVYYQDKEKRPFLQCMALRVIRAPGEDSEARGGTRTGEIKEMIYQQFQDQEMKQLLVCFNYNRTIVRCQIDRAAQFLLNNYVVMGSCSPALMTGGAPPDENRSGAP